MLRDGKRLAGSRALVHIGVLGSFSEIPFFPDPLAISPTDVHSDHWQADSQENDPNDVNIRECPVDRSGDLLQSEAVPHTVCIFSGKSIIEDDFGTSSTLVRMRLIKPEVSIVGFVNDDVVPKSSLLEQVPPPHTRMVISYKAFIQDSGTEIDKASISRRIRYGLSVRGVKMLDIRYKLHHWFRDWLDIHGAVSIQTQKDFAFHLIESEWYEDKLAAVLFIQEILIAKKMISFTDFPWFEEMFQGGHIKVHKVCDHFASKILCHFLRQSTLSPYQKAWILDCLFDWTSAEDLWQARAAMFTLGDQAKNGICPDRLMHSVKHVLARPEDEAKSVAGSVLRSVSEVNPGTVVEFLSRPENLTGLSTSGLEKATSRLRKRHRESFKSLRRQLCSNSID